MFTQKVIDDINVTDEGVHQAVLDLGYNEWQHDRTDNWAYSDMINFMQTTYGDLAVLAVLLGKYNQQVNNGGHAQYYDNAYASVNSRGCFGNKEGIELHETLMELFDKYEMTTLKGGDEVYSIMKDFVQASDEGGSCYDCGGSGGEYAEDEEDEEGNRIDGEWEDCYICNGTGDDDSQIGNTGHLDTRYYNLKKWEKEMEAFFVSKLAQSRVLPAAA